MSEPSENKTKKQKDKENKNKKKWAFSSAHLHQCLVGWYCLTCMDLCRKVSPYLVLSNPADFTVTDLQWPFSFYSRMCKKNKIEPSIAPFLARIWHNASQI